jgi:YD repeat-containing protein
VTTEGINTTNQFTYSSNNSGELTQAILPYGGYLSWAYTNVTYSNSSGTTYREVANRYLSKDGTSNTANYAFSHEASPGPNVRQYTIITDPSGATREWTFGQSGVTMGLVTTTQANPSTGMSDVSSLTWTQDSASNSYIGSVLINSTVTIGGRQNNLEKWMDQTVDTHGNVTQVNQYNFGSSHTNPARTYNYTYLNSSSYTSRYIFNRLTQATVTDNATTTLTLVTNGYDQTNPTSQGPSNNWDLAYATISTRGNLTTSTTLNSNKTITYDTAGDPTGVTLNGVAASITMVGTNNYAAPTALTAGSLTQSLSWTPSIAPASTTGPNGDVTTMTYDTYGRPTGGTSPFGAVTTITYSSAPYTTSSPAVVTTTVNGRWTSRTLDGLGRTVKVQKGDANGTQSVAESVYGSGGGSPTGVLLQQAMPHASGGTPAYTTRTYDGEVEP